MKKAVKIVKLKNNTKTKIWKIWKDIGNKINKHALATSNLSKSSMKVFLINNFWLYIHIKTIRGLQLRSLGKINWCSLDWNIALYVKLKSCLNVIIHLSIGWTIYSQTSIGYIWWCLTYLELICISYSKPRRDLKSILSSSLQFR